MAWRLPCPIAEWEARLVRKMLVHGVALGLVVAAIVVVSQRPSRRLTAEG
jgi:hypothetical protein